MLDLSYPKEEKTKGKKIFMLFLKLSVNFFKFLGDIIDVKLHETPYIVEGKKIYKTLILKHIEK